jgi:hypothetical protein
MQRKLLSYLYKELEIGFVLFIRLVGLLELVRG